MAFGARCQTTKQYLRHLSGVARTVHVASSGPLVVISCTCGHALCGPNLSTSKYTRAGGVATEGCLRISELVLIRVLEESRRNPVSKPPRFSGMQEILSQPKSARTGQTTRVTLPPSAAVAYFTRPCISGTSTSKQASTGSIRHGRSRISCARRRARTARGGGNTLSTVRGHPRRRVKGIFRNHGDNRRSCRLRLTAASERGCWSGRPGSNRRRPAWENESRW